MNHTTFRCSLFLATVIILTLGESACAKKKFEFTVPESEIAKMTEEGEDFIDEVNDGRQDRQSEAIRHALKGSSAELSEIRKARISSSCIGDSEIEKTDLTGEGAARGVSMRLYKMKNLSNKNIPMLVYFHGGGWTIGGLNSSDAFCDSLASSGNIAVLSVDYSLAPENSYPKGMLDCVSAIEFAIDKAEEFGCSPSGISVGGDSAGGNLALSSVLYMNKDNTSGKKVKSVVVYYPVVKGYPDESQSWKSYSRGYGLDGKLMETFISAYVPDGDSRDPFVSPIEASEEALSTLPPILIINAERDILADQGKEFYEKICKAGVDATRIVFPGALHLFITVPGQATARGLASEITKQYLTR